MGQALVYYRIGLPWPISDRDWVVRYRYAAHGESGFEMSWSERMTWVRAVTRPSAYSSRAGLAAHFHGK